VEHVDELVAYAEATAACTRCRLAQGRTQVVFGAGNPRADLLFVGEAPGFHEDKQGLPFVGQAGKLLEKLLAGIGMTRQDVYIANVLKCRPPGNRDPQPDEIEACESHLFRQIELIEPTVVATLGNFATKLLSGRPLGITRVHGQEQATTIGGRNVLLYPLYHPAAALYTRDGRLFVANGNRNTVSVIDTRKSQVIEQIDVALVPKSPLGSTPNALALSKDGTKLFVAVILWSSPWARRINE